MSQETVHGNEEKEILHEFRSLLRHPGWARLVELAETQMEGRERQILLNEMNTEEEVNEVRRLKAERLGIKLFLALPGTIIDTIEEENESHVQNES